MGDNEFKDFDPQAYWADVNNDVTKLTPGIKERIKLEEFIDFCDKERSTDEIFETCRIHKGRLHRFLTIVLNTRGLILYFRETPDGDFYRIQDARHAVV